jgi:hypothetical protein
VPPASVSVYSTRTGLREPLRALEEWSIAHIGDVSASQEAYDRADRPPPESTDRDK